MKEINRISSPSQKRVNKLIHWILSDYDLTSSQVLEVGAGTGRHVSYNLRNRCKKLVGIDISSEVLQNPLLDEAYVESAYETHFPDKYFTVIFGVMVLEHIEYPLAFLQEMYRILKPGGAFYFVTPNAWHYFTCLSTLIPEGFAVKYLSWRDKQHHSQREHFVTYYRLNTKRAITKFARFVGFNGIQIRYHESDDVAFYFPKPFKVIPHFYSVMVNRLQFLSKFKVNMLSKLAK